jgi:phosphohistidine swiveling domain-containing protein
MSEPTWTHDPSHYPEPMTPLSADVWFWAMGLGIQAAARELRAPFGGFETMVADGGWAYEHDLEPSWEPDPRRLRTAALTIAERWRAELRDRSHAVTDALRRLRPERGTPAEAVAAFDRLLALVREQWVVHFLTVIPVHAAREVLHDAYVERLGKDDELEPYRLIEGIPNETLEADERLWSVAELARQLDVADVVMELPGDAALRALATTHHGREVLGELSGYLRRFGGRSRLHELSEPRDAERPEMVLETVRLFLEHPRDLAAERRARARTRDELEASVLARISDADERGEFAGLLANVVAAVALEETHAYHIDYPGLAATREALLGFGRRLVAEGRLDRSADVFMLRREELRSAVADAWGEGLQALAEQRAAELAHARATQPKPFLGPPPESPAELPAMVAKFYGVPGTASHEGDLIRGTAASAGKATGIARLVRDARDFSRLTAGDVLVSPTTTPAWTPVFTSIGGLVTDSGGILCHAAVVAREYGLPAVVGTDAATRLIPDGALVSVDGTTGEVHIVRRAARS